jgi:hypothetical protein
MTARLRTFLAAPVALVAALAALPGATSAQQQDERAVVAVLEKLFDAMRTRDTTAMRSVFTAEARLIGQSTRDGATTIQVTPAAQFIASIAAIPPDREIVERIYQPEVSIDGDLASFWAFYTLHVSDQFSHCGVDAAHLFRTPDGWKIVSLADTRRREGCDPPGTR